MSLNVHSDHIELPSLYFIFTVDESITRLQVCPHHLYRLLTVGFPSSLDKVRVGSCCNSVQVPVIEVSNDELSVLYVEVVFTLLEVTVQLDLTRAYPLNSKFFIS